MIDLLLQEWEGKTIYELPDAQLFQMLSYLQMMPERINDVHKQVPNFLNYTCRHITDSMLDSFFWNPSFVRAHAHILEKHSFYDRLSPKITGVYSEYYVLNNPPEISEIPAFIDVLNNKRGDNIHFSYMDQTPIPEEMLEYWFHKNPKQCLMYLNNVLVSAMSGTPLLKTLITMAPTFYSLYQKTEEPAFMIATQLGAMNGFSVEDKNRGKAQLKKMNVKPWNKNIYHKFIEQHANRLCDFMLPVLIKTRPGSQDGNERKMELWMLMRPHLDITRLYMLGNRWFCVSADTDYFEDSALAEKHHQFKGLVSLGVMDKSQYHDYLSGTIQVDQHPTEEIILI